MGLSLITTVEIGSHYPDTVLINSAANDEGKWAGFMYMLNEDGSIHKCWVNSDFVFESEEDSNKYFHDLGEWCTKYIKENEVFG